MSTLNLEYLGHAGWLIEGDNFRCICDPWFGPSGAFFFSMAAISHQ